MDYKLQYLRGLGLEEVDSDARPDGTDRIWWGYYYEFHYEISDSDLQYHATNNSSFEDFKSDCEVSKETCCGDLVDLDTSLCPSCYEHV
jgi:hypothetical protein